jgi:Flp pilus assembly protein TadB
MAQEPDTDRNDAVTGEIIPPDRTHARSTRGTPGIRISAKTPGSGFIYAATPRPFVIVMVLLAFAILLAAILLFLLGTLLIGILAFGVLLTVLLLSRFIRRHFRRLR